MPYKAEELAETLKVIAHPVRLSIVSYLISPSIAERSVSQIMSWLDLPQAIASQHLINLKNRGVLESRKQGTSVFYSVAGSAVDICRTVVQLLEK